MLRGTASSFNQVHPLFYCSSHPDPSSEEQKVSVPPTLSIGIQTAFCLTGICLLQKFNGYSVLSLHKVSHIFLHDGNQVYAGI